MGVFKTKTHAEISANNLSHKHNLLSLVTNEFSG